MTLGTGKSLASASGGRLQEVSKTLHVVFAADANYAMPLAVAMCSVALNCDRRRALRFHVIQLDIVGELRGRIEKSLVDTGFPDATISWLALPLDRVVDLKLGMSYTTPLTFARLLIDELIPPFVSKALYLDCDIVVLRDISGLWDTDMAGKAIWAARDMIASVSSPSGIANYRELGIPAEASYFNAGVLLVNVDKWRKESIGATLREYLRTHRDVVQMADQEALNAVLWDDWGLLEFRWNSQIPWRGIRKGWAKPEWRPEVSEKCIVHFTSAEKPWRAGCDYDERHLFYRYLDMTEWKGWRISWRREVLSRTATWLVDTRNAIGRLKQRFRKVLTRSCAA